MINRTNIPYINERLSFLYSGDKINTARMKWMAFQQPLQRHPSAFTYAIFCHRLNSIHGTRGIKTTTRPQKRRNQKMIQRYNYTKDIPCRISANGIRIEGNIRGFQQIHLRFDVSLIFRTDISTYWIAAVMKGLMQTFWQSHDNPSVWGYPVYASEKIPGPNV